MSTIMTALMFLLATCALLSPSLAFTPAPHRSSRSRPSLKLSSASIEGEEEDPLADIPQDRKEFLFEALLRDLQVEGVPLLGCDADQVHTLQAALWTTMAELSEQDGELKACLVMEQIPTAALQAFVDDFLVLKTQNDQMQYLPELDRVSASLVGRGLGPAILLEVTNKTAATTPPAAALADEFRCSAAMKAFTNRVVIGGGGDDSIGLGDEGSAAPIQYGFSSSAHVCATVSSFWNGVCEMMSVSEQDIGTLCLQLPSVDTHERFAAISQLLSRSLCLYQGDSVFSLVHFHPQYDRSKITPVDQPAFGHLPPMGWLRPMLKANGDDSADDDISDEALANANYQRRSPIAAVNIVRNSLLADPKMVNIELEGGAVTMASGLETYCPNTVKLAGTDPAVLQQALDAEISIASA